MGSFMAVENISAADFNQLQSMGWVLVCVDNMSAKSNGVKFVYRFQRAW